MLIPLPMFPSFIFYERYPTLQMHCTKILKQIFLDIKLRGLVPNFCMHVSVSDLYIPTNGPPVLLHCVCGLIVGIHKSITDGYMDVEIGKEGAQFHFLIKIRLSTYAKGISEPLRNL
jgi:hypothetical protein